MAAAAEVLERTSVVIIPNMPEELLACEQAEKLIRQAELAGGVAVAATTSMEAVTEGEPSYPSLQVAIEAAARGELEARRFVEANVRTDVIERSIKAGFVITAHLQTNEQGKIYQHGQLMDDVHLNALRFAAHGDQMLARTKAEVRNGARIERLNQLGLLEGNYVVVISRAADNMTVEQMEAAGYFTDTMSCAIQATTKAGGSLITESAFVAGVVRPGAERHDEAAVIGVGDRLGVNLRGLSATQVVDTPLLVPKELMPHGVVDIAQLYDRIAAALTAETIFFGQATFPKDYGTFKAECEARQAELEPTVRAIADELLAEASAIKTPSQATERLHQLSQKHLVARSVTDTKIDPSVFGRTAAQYIHDARYLYKQGDLEQSQAALQAAQDTAQSSSCPTGKRTSGEQQESDDGPCEFTSKKCPECGKENVKTVVTRRSDGKKQIDGSCGCQKVI